MYFRGVIGQRKLCGDPGIPSNETGWEDYQEPFSRSPCLVDLLTTFSPESRYTPLPGCAG